MSDELVFLKVQPILVWAFDEAPPEYQAISPHGGDEDWLALVPASFYERHGEGGTPFWLEHGSFGSCDISHAVLDSGDHVFIGAHA